MAHPEEDNAIFWHRPEKRGIIPLESFKIPKNLARLYRQAPFKLKINQDFEGVMRACASRSDTWISEEIIQSYNTLYELNMAMSFECWNNDELVGGLYGVSISKAFFGESMFHKASNASKIALVFLVEFLKKEGYTLLDTQYLNPHLVQFGGIEIDAAEYDQLLAKALMPS